MSSTTATGNQPNGHQPAGGQQPTRTPAALIAFAWTLVGVPLAYGLYQTVKTAADLFGG
jgi:hypothetical protein